MFDYLIHGSHFYMICTWKFDLLFLVIILWRSPFYTGTFLQMICYTLCNNPLLLLAYPQLHAICKQLKYYFFYFRLISIPKQINGNGMLVMLNRNKLNLMYSFLPYNVLKVSLNIFLSCMQRVRNQHLPTLKKSKNPVTDFILRRR